MKKKHAHVTTTTTTTTHRPKIAVNNIFKKYIKREKSHE